MHSFGEKLRQERETRNRAVEEIADATKIQLSFLEALERNEFDELPGRAFGKLYIRAYAEVLDFDPQPLIDDYDREQSRQERERRAAEPQPDRAARPAPRSGLHTPRRRLQPEPPVTPEPAIEPEVPAAESEPPEIVATDPVAEPDPPETTHGETVIPSGWVTPRRSPTESGVRRRVMILIAASVVAFAGWTLFAFLRTQDDAGPGVTHSSPPERSVGEVREEPFADRPVVQAAAPSETEAHDPAVDMPEVTGESVADPPPQARPAVNEPSDLNVSDHGVGRRIVNRRLQERGDRFAEGEVVWFSTRVLGGARGESIRHVWLRDGKTMQSTVLEIGGSHWRTHSRKTLWGTGQWMVEARDVEGRVLAQTAFLCVPRGS